MKKKTNMFSVNLYSSLIDGKMLSLSSQKPKEPDNSSNFVFQNPYLITLSLSSALNSSFRMQIIQNTAEKSLIWWLLVAEVEKTLLRNKSINFFSRYCSRWRNSMFDIWETLIHCAKQHFGTQYTFSIKELVLCNWNGCKKCTLSTAFIVKKRSVAFWNESTFQEKRLLIEENFSAITSCACFVELLKWKTRALFPVRTDTNFLKFVLSFPHIVNKLSCWE